MMTALAVGLDPETRQRVLPLLGDRELAVENVQSAEAALLLAEHRSFDLVACTYPLPDMVLRRFTAAVRHRGSASRDAALLVLTLPDMRSEARLGMPRGRALVMSRRDPQQLLAETIRQLLRIRPRRAMELPVSLRLIDVGGDEIDALTVNLSHSGMLVRHPSLPPISVRCEFRLTTDAGRELIGAGEVVRHSSPRREQVQGFAVRFDELRGDAEQLLEDTLSTS